MLLLRYKQIPPISFPGSGRHNSNQTKRKTIVQDSGWYYLTLTGTNGCSWTDSIFVFQRDKIPDLTMSGDTLSCMNDSIQIMAFSNSQVRFMWTGPGGFQSKSRSPFVRDSGFYTVQIIDSLGCELSREIYIPAFRDIPEFFIKNDTLTCTRPMIDIKASALSNTDDYHWTAPDGTVYRDSSVSISVPGKYLFTASNRFGCTTTDSITVIDKQQKPVINLSDSLLTCRDTAIYTGAFSPDIGAQYNWAGPGAIQQSQDSFWLNRSGVYTVLVTNRYGCRDSAQMTIGIDTSRPGTMLMSDSIGCGKSTADLIAFGHGSDIDLFWSGPDVSNPTEDSLKVSKGGTYLLVLTDPKNGCQRSYRQFVYEDTAAIRQVDITSTDAYCDSLTGQLQLGVILGGTPPYKMEY